MAHFHLATSRLKDGDISAAIEDFKRSEQIESSPAIHDGLGCCFHSMKDYENALAAFDKAINAEPTNIEFLKNRS